MESMDFSELSAIAPIFTELSAIWDSGFGGSFGPRESKFGPNFVGISSFWSKIRHFLGFWT